MANTQISSGTGVNHPIETTSSSNSNENYAAKVKKAANNASSQVSRFADDASAQVSTAYDSATSAVGRKIADTGAKVEHSDLVQRTGRKMSDVGRYLDESKIEDLSSYARTTVRRNPLAAVAIGVGAGVLIGRWISK